MKYKIVASDIDGTLLDKNSVLNERTVNAVKATIKKDVCFVLSTGRSLPAISEFKKVLGLNDAPYILYNGAVVMIGAKTIYSLSIDPLAARLAFDEGHKRNSTMICWSENKLYCETLCKRVEEYKKLSGVEPIVLPDLNAVADRGITKILWLDDKETTMRNYTQLNGVLKGLNITPSNADFLEFVNKDCSKATALEILLKKLGFSAKECVAVGDGYNDIPMLEYAGLGVAMGNAAETVKSSCDYTTADCDHYGLAVLLEKLFL